MVLIFVVPLFTNVTDHANIALTWFEEIEERPDERKRRGTRRMDSYV